MSTSSCIELIEHPDSIMLYQARYDEAIVTGQRHVERPFWYRHKQTGQLFHDLYACLGYPTEISGKDEGMPGYIAIIGVIRPTETLEQYNPLNANFQLLTEFESKDVPTLLSKCVEMRREYGFKLTPHLLNVWHGDPTRFATTLALKNEDLIRQGGENNAILVVPSVDLYEPKVFDNYIRSLKSCMLHKNKRFYFGGCSILKNHLREFRKDNPAAFAVGGLVHTLLTNCTWMAETGKGIFNIEENYV